MISDYLPVRTLDLTLVTELVLITGTIETRLRRLTDVFNDADSAALVLNDATFMEVGSRRVLAQAPAAQVSLTEVLFAHTNGETDSGGEQKMPKQPIKATLLVRPYTIEGEIYLPYESELKIALQAYTGRFLPVTSARYWADLAAEAPVNVDFLVVNHTLAHVAVASGTEWRGEMPRDTGGGSNPW